MRPITAYYGSASPSPTLSASSSASASPGQLPTSLAPTGTALATQGLQPAARIGIGVGVATGVLLLILGLCAFFFLRRRWKRKESQDGGFEKAELHSEHLAVPFPLQEIGDKDVQELGSKEKWVFELEGDMGKVAEVDGGEGKMVGRGELETGVRISITDIKNADFGRGNCEESPDTVSNAGFEDFGSEDTRSVELRKYR